MAVRMTSTLEDAAPRWYSHPYNRANFYRLAAALTWVPRRLRLAVARQVGRLAPSLMPGERAAIETSMARFTGATGPQLEKLTLRVFTDFAMCFSDLVSTNRQPTTLRSPHLGHVEGIERLTTTLSGGLISLTAHVGNWELAGRLLAGKSSRPTHVVVAPDELRELERWVRRDGEGVRFVSRARPTVSLELLAALRRGEVVGVQGDRALGTRGDIEVPFFGRPARFPLGPFLLSSGVKVPLLPAFCLLDSQYRYVVKIAEPFVAVRGEEEAAARTWVAALEDIVRQYPTQWFNFFDIWEPFAR
ncbi:MAG TPA: lysophospholipid acyltransferase family protein [Solirubrobacterales bacterium]|nr:lysophospholipid acyltransferase family protein [Solirubrobacterales bacterium]